jgi:hypothetical protein
MMGSMVLRVFIICSEFVCLCVVWLFLVCMVLVLFRDVSLTQKKCFTQFFGGSRYKLCMFWVVGNWDGLLDKTFISTLSLEEWRDDGSG